MLLSTRLRNRIKLSLGLQNLIRLRLYKEDPRIPVDRQTTKKLSKRGFLPGSIHYYDFDRYGYEAYVTHWGYMKLHPINGTFSRLIDNKAFVPVLMRNNPEWLPEICISFDRGRVGYAYGFAQNGRNGGELLKAAVKHAGKLIVKPVNATGGNKVEILTGENIDAFIEEKLYTRSKYLVNNVLVNETYSARIWPDAVNTIRVVFFRTASGSNRVFRILHRFGTAESGHVDNCGKGGMVAVVDLQKGVMGKGLIYKGSARYGYHEHHVDTGAQIAGAAIPDWPRKLKTIEQIVAQLDFLDYGGLDLAPTPDGLKILEINSLPEITLCQLEEPALLDEEFREFIIKKGYRVA